jgi:hypothetical protein
MASSSSTSSSELSPYERVRIERTPKAAIAFFVLVVLVELTLGTHRVWFADHAAWQWETKRTLIAQGALDGDVAIFGTSVLFHGLDPTPANRESSSGRVVNLALNGMMLQHQAQLLRDRIAAGRAPSVAVLEFRQVIVEHESWFRGPYYRFWASWPEFLESRFYYWNLPLAFGFAENRLLPSFRYREAIDNWIFESARALRPAEHTRQRNLATDASMRQREGMMSAFETNSLAGYAGPQVPRVWAVNQAGERWLREFLDVAGSHQIQVVLLAPPAPPYMVETPGPDGYRAQFTAYVDRLRREHRSTDIEVFEPGGYSLADFADGVHLSVSGREKMSEQFASWFHDYSTRRALSRSARPALTRVSMK